MRIVMLEPLAITQAEVMEQARPLLDAGHTLEFCGGPLSVQEKKERAAGADVLVVANAPLGADILREAKELKMLSVAFTGVDHVDMDYCRAHGVTVCNAQGYCTDAVAEVTWGLILAVLRRIADCNAAVRTGGTRAGRIGHEVRGKTIGLVGTGAIARRVAELARAFGCPVIGYSRRPGDAAARAGIETVALDEVFSRADIVSLHVPLTAETLNMVDARRIALMKPGAVLINTARGAVVDNDALAAALQAGKIGGAGIDVFEMEPPIPQDHPLCGCDNALLTPHIAFSTEESLLRRAQIVFSNIAAWAQGAPQNVSR